MVRVAKDGDGMSACFDCDALGDRQLVDSPTDLEPPQHPPPCKPRVSSPRPPTMYHLFKSIYLHATSKEEYSILLLGLDNAGKTTLLEQIKAAYTPTHPNLRTVPTVGQNVATVSLPPPNPPIYLKIWDVGGQHSLRGLWQSYYTSCHAIVFVIDSTDIGDADIAHLATDAGRNEEHGRLDECRLVLEDVLQNEDAVGVPVLVLANKQDREDCVEVVRIKEGLVRKVFEGEKGGNVRDSRVLPCSALTGTGVREAVEWLCSRVKWNKEARPPVMR
ncbi:Arf-domain-containing protein [Lojkania enalia]|uniref:Arf-domain-containing protein n=1 Tax=Lojkania enalia TaxID=147567 RepID=A0A9P4JY73_9PLEO|nr:Arf-domain-containing protein [Didymosphaeria enalia]